MAYNFEYPYTDISRANSDWLLNRMKELESEFIEFVKLNRIKYANPIEWSIVKQYEKNTVIIDPESGDAYLSVKDVPQGVMLSNTDYWTPIFNYENSLNKIREEIAKANEEKSTTATEDRTKEDLVWLNGNLIRITADMIAGDSYVLGSNCVDTTVEAEINRRIDLLRDYVDASDLALSNAISDEATARAELAEDVEEISYRVDDLEILKDNIKLWACSPNSSTSDGGDATVLLLPNGKYMLVDTFDVEDFSILSNLLTTAGCDHLDYIYITHYHNDHDGALYNDLLSDYIDSNTVLFTQDLRGTRYQATHGARQNQVVSGVTSHGGSVVYPNEGQTITLDVERNITIKFNNCKTTIDQFFDVMDFNNTSMVGKIVYGDTSLFISGDISLEAQKSLCGKVGKVTIYKAHHHGSDEFQDSGWLKEVAPEKIYVMPNKAHYSDWYIKRSFLNTCDRLGYSVCDGYDNTYMTFKFNAYGITEDYNKYHKSIDIIRFPKEVIPRSEWTTCTILKFCTEYVPFYTEVNCMINATTYPRICSDLKFPSTGGLVLSFYKGWNNYFRIEAHDLITHTTRYYLIWGDTLIDDTVLNEMYFRTDVASAGAKASFNYLSGSMNSTLGDTKIPLVGNDCYRANINVNLVIPNGFTAQFVTVSILNRSYTFYVPANSSGSQKILTYSINDSVDIGTTGNYYLTAPSVCSAQFTGSITHIPDMATS